MREITVGHFIFPWRILWKRYRAVILRLCSRFVSCNRWRKYESLKKKSTWNVHQDLWYGELLSRFSIKRRSFVFHFIRSFGTTGGSAATLSGAWYRSARWAWPLRVPGRTPQDWTPLRPALQAELQLRAVRTRPASTAPTRQWTSDCSSCGAACRRRNAGCGRVRRNGSWNSCSAYSGSESKYISFEDFIFISFNATFSSKSVGTQFVKI